MLSLLNVNSFELMYLMSGTNSVELKCFLDCMNQTARA